MTTKNITQSQINTFTQEDQKQKLKKPPKYKIILHNDNYTTMEFVVFILINIFHKNLETAKELMLKIHHKNKAIIGIYPKEIAKMKVNKVNKKAKQAQYPLKITMEKNAY